MDNVKKGIEIPSVIKRCPECHNLSLEYDLINGMIICRNCGFKQEIMR